MNQQHPATVYLSVNPRAEADRVRVLSKPFEPEDFRRFLDGCLVQTPARPRRSDNWVFGYEFPDGRELPPLAPGADHGNYFLLVRELAARRDLHPAQVASVRDACFCREYGIDLFSEQGQHEALEQTPGYKAFGTRFGIYGPQGDRFPTCRAVDIGPGVLLYALGSSPGREAYRSLLQHCADRFYDPQLRIDSLRFYDLHTFLDTRLLEKNMGTLNFNFNHRPRNFSFGDLTRLPLLDKDLLHEGIFVKGYDMSPTSASYVRFLVGENLQPREPTRTYDIALLDHIVREGYPAERPNAELPFLSSYMRQFRDLAEQIVECEDPEQMQDLQDAARRRASHLLERDYPDRRIDTRQPSRELYLEIPSRAFNQGPKI